MKQLSQHKQIYFKLTFEMNSNFVQKEDIALHPIHIQSFFQKTCDNKVNKQLKMLIAEVMTPMMTS